MGLILPKVKKVEYQENPGWTWRFDYAGWAYRITFSDDSVLHLHYDEDNKYAASYTGSENQLPFEVEGSGRRLILVLLGLDPDGPHVDLEVDWQKYWYVDQEWRIPRDAPTSDS